MKIFVAVFLTLVVALGVSYMVYNYAPSSSSNPAGNSDLKAAQKAIADRDATITQLKAAASVYVSPSDKLDAAAKAGLTEQPGWQAMKIVEHGGDGSMFYQLEASTRKDGNVSTVGPHGFSWRSTTDDALEAAKLRRGSPEEKEAEPPK